MVSFRNLLLVVVAAFFIALISSYAINRYRYIRHGDTGEIASLTFINPKTGKSKNYHISEFLENGPNYVRFLTTDGRVVEIVETEVKEY